MIYFIASRVDDFKIKIKIRIYANIYMILMSEECRENGRHSANNAIEIYNYGMNV